MKQTSIGTIEPNEDGTNKATASVFHSLNPLERTGAQVNILRSIFDTTHDFLISAKSPSEGFEVHGPSVEEAAKTAELAFLQLRHIIDDQKRWSSEDGETEREAKALLEAEINKAKVDAKLKEQLTRPFFLLRASIFKTTTGKFVATNDARSITGFGDTPDEASKQFDVSFFQKPEAVASPSAEPTTPKKRKKK